MKRFSAIILILLLAAVFSLPASVSAATNPGVKPGSFFYFFDTTFEKIGLFFTVNPEQKARKALGYAEERLAEIEAIAEEKDPDAVKTAIADYENNVALAAEKSKEIKNKGQAESLLASIEDNASKNQEVLSAVLIKVPEEAKEAITKAIEASKKGQEEAAKQIAELKGEVEKLKQEVADLKTKDEEKGKIIEELSKQKPETPTAQTKPPTPQTIETIQTQKPATPPPQISATTTSTVTLPNGAIISLHPTVSTDALDFKLSYKLGTSTVIFIADGYRDNLSIRGWFEWWSKRPSDIEYVIFKKMDSLSLAEKKDITVVPVQFTTEVPLEGLSPYNTRGYVQHFFQFRFERGNIFNSPSGIIQFEAGSY